MGKAAKAVTKAVTSTVKSVAKTATKAFVQPSIDVVKSVAKGDIKGVADAAARVASAGTISLKGDSGVLNTHLLDKEVKQPSTPVAQKDIETDGLLQYVSDLRTRKSRRNRASTNNTEGSASTNANKLSGTTALGV